VSAGALLELIPARGSDPAVRARLVRRARVLAYAGIGWHVVEFAIALGAGLAASSIALVGFGVDSLIEALAGGVVIWLFAARRASSPTAERRAQQVIAASFFVLAVYIGVEAIHALVVSDEPSRSWVGIGLAAVTAPTMPLLARAKTRLARQLGSPAAASEGAQTMLCAYLSVALLVGLGANAIAGWWWADPLAALAIAGVAVREGVQGWRGEGDSCCAPVLGVAEPVHGDRGCGADDCC
jgi:divalent metal cation (Fe/Co/Zn/Cd) transporter